MWRHDVWGMTMTTQQTATKHRLTWAFLLAGLTFAFGCTKAGKSVVTVEIEPVSPSNAALAGLSDVDVTVKPVGSGPSASANFKITDRTVKNTFGVYVDSSVSGMVAVMVVGNASGTPIADGTGMTSVTPGQKTLPVAITLGARTGATGGMGGTAPGSGGMGGMVAGSGGVTNPGTGGHSGGTGGMTPPGTGGLAMPGTGGMTMPGTGGAAGGSPGTGGGSGGAGGKGAIGGGAVGGMAAGGKSGRAWQGQVLAETADLVDNYVPVVAVDGKGNIVAVYMHGSGLAATYYDYSKGTWGAETPIDASSGTNITETPNVAVDKNGNWLAVWQQDADVSQHGIWQSTSTDGVHWTAPAAITTTGKLYEPVLGMGPDGTAVVVWTENVPPDNHFTLTASVRVNGTWTAPHVLRPGEDAGERYAAAAVTSNGTAIVTWEQGDGTTQDQLSVWQARFTGGTWSAASLVETYTGGNADSANVATNNNGQSILTWIQNTDSTSALWAQRYPATGAPEAPMKVSEGSNIAWTPSPAVTLDDSGTATLAWAFEVKQKFQVYTTRGAWGQPWAAVTAMETDDNAADDPSIGDYEWVTAPMVGHDTAGNVALVWKKRTGTRFDLWARNYDVATATWGPGTLLETMDAHDVIAPAMAMGPSGVAVAAWYYGYEYDIWANVYR